MTDYNRDPSVPPEDAPPRGGKAKTVPPLAWIILGLLLLAVIIGMSQCQGTHVTPGGGETPQAQIGDPAEAVMPETNDPLTAPPAAIAPEQVQPATNAATPTTAPAGVPPTR